MKIKRWVSIVFIFLAPLIARPVIFEPEKMDYSIRFEKDSVEINVPVSLEISFFLKNITGEFCVNGLEFPSQPWLEFGGMGQEIRYLSDSTRKIIIRAKIRFLQTGTFIIHPVICDFMVDSVAYNLLLNTPEIVVHDPSEEWRNYLTPKVIISSTIFILMLIFAIQQTIRFGIRRKKEKEFSGGITGNREILTRMEMLLLDRRLNYKKNVQQLYKLMAEFLKEEGENVDLKFPNRMEELEQLGRKQFVTFKQFEPIYVEFYQYLLERKKNREEE